MILRAPRCPARALLFALVCTGAVAGCRCKGSGGDATTDASKESPSALHLKDVPDLAEPTSRSAEAVPVDGIAVYVTRTKVLLGDELTEVLALGDPAAVAKDGVDRKYKPGDSHYVVVLADAITALRKKKGLGEWIPAAIAMDASIPYAVFSDVLVTLQRLRFERYALVVRNDQGLRAALQLSFAPRGLTPGPPPAPSTFGSAPAPDATVYLGVRLDDEGYVVRAFGRELGAGCVIGPGVTIGKRAGAYDDEALTACAIQKKAMAPSTRDDAVTITSLPGIDYQTIVRTLDALRKTRDGKPLFPAASFAIVH
jgi:hypothetical protein